MGQLSSRVVLFDAEQARFQEPPTPPFTLYGIVSKRFIIENLSGDKVRRLQLRKQHCASL